MIQKKHNKILKEFGTHIKQIRQTKGLSLRELSSECDIDNSKISKIERGGINVTLLTVIELAQGLDVPPMELLKFSNK